MSEGSGKVLLVDDDRNLVELLRMRLESAGYGVVSCSTEEDALETIKNQDFDLSIVDLKLVHQNGILLMEKLHSVDPLLPVIILTAHGSIESAVQAIQRGAYTYLTKPFQSHDLMLQVEKAVENHRLTSEITRLKGLVTENYGFTNIVAKGPGMQRVLDALSRIAKTDSTVYIHGESGTGKELVAKAIHIASGRKDQAFVAINCAAIPETLLESELFGHEKGAFSGAIRKSKGLFSQAHKGTLFLDEIGDMPLPVQAKLLRALQERQFYPVGSERPVEVDVRVIVATKKDLAEEVKNGLFRQDLFYRIHVIPISLPPLRERKEDIPYLAEHFLKRLSRQMKKEVHGLTPGALVKMTSYDWPGNVRELENTIEYAIVMTQHKVIGEELILNPGGGYQKRLKPLKEARDAFERDYLVQLLELSGGNISKAAKLAGKYRADLYDLLKKHSLKITDFKGSETPVGKELQPRL